MSNNSLLYAIPRRPFGEVVSENKYVDKSISCTLESEMEGPPGTET